MERQKTTKTPAVGVRKWLNRTVILRGAFRILFLYDVAEALDLPKIAELLGPRGGAMKQSLPRRTPEYVRFEHPPIVEPAAACTLSSGEQAICSIKYYSFAAVVVQMEVPFEADWKTLVERASTWIDASDAEPQARELLRRHLDRLSPSVIRPTPEWLHEEFVVINLQDAETVDHRERPTASELLSRHGQEIVQLVRGETAVFSPRLTEDMLQHSLSYYETDLVVIGANSALVYDRSEDALATNQVLEYTKMQLLEFRYYDGLLTKLLSDVYDAMEKSRNVLLSRWALPRQAKHVNTIRLDVMELTERVDNAVKFVSDAYYARVYRTAAARMGLSDYRKLVDEKLRTVGELYDFMVDQFNEARSFVLELGIAFLCLLDVILLLRGK
jgi:hypothetical protein